MKRLEGIAASRGIAIGPTFLYRQVNLDFERRKVDDLQAEWERFESAAEQAKEQLREIESQTEESVGSDEAALFEAHRMMLEDPDLLEQIHQTIKEERINAEAAIRDASESYARMMEALDSEYMKARAADVRDVANRVLRILLGKAESPSEGLTEPSIILARDLAPSDTALMDKSLVLGFCTAEGGPTSHTAILARGLGIPAIVGAELEILAIAEGTRLVLDGVEGTLIVEPDEETVAEYEGQQQTMSDILEGAREKAGEPAITEEGYRVEVVANIGNVTGAEAALENGAEGVGLLRTEFLYLERDHLPDEEEQYEAYRAILETMGDRPVILRTLDIGGDKELPYMEMPAEMNPFLGVRAIRLALKRPELLKPQLRAALRAGVGHDLKIMFPMVARAEEIRRARALLDECRAELEAEGRAVAEGLEIGIMIEIPSAALMADQLAAMVDFFSIGTNDLSQYTLAADRTNPDVAPMASGFQPAVLRLVRNVIHAAHAKGKWVGLCGELAGDPLAIPILLGLGLDEFSMNPPAIPLAKQIIRTLSLEETQALAEEALEQENPEAIKALVRERFPAADIG
ncbi:MAG: phosphoenolpyruvate--protein phosphotransferase [Anaerolineales bacterium]